MFSLDNISNAEQWGIATVVGLVIINILLLVFLLYRKVCKKIAKRMDGNADYLDVMAMGLLFFGGGGFFLFIVIGSVKEIMF